ncbi:hypothetical protein NEOLI_000236 [Neolecta irregularis DAH-3]|uniref:Uncharacterized protein n=1 Tax=Neolecta irregularis (strain DAH-3) TaxID=1198029 RepID=A0A1U7LIX4_NEOID|nr:hypothetical protein NEOLI_000236 [Neolecta irregularis DAH-3]|eukprot:OLL22610.1 hypothetical protein NEOLI_000236 [Neolecta irregularis DAH-3]
MEDNLISTQHQWKNSDDEASSNVEVTYADMLSNGISRDLIICSFGGVNEFCLVWFHRWGVCRRLYHLQTSGTTPEQEP